jgi:EpsI family protein
MLILLGGFGTYLRSHQTEPDRGPDFSQIPMETNIYYGTEHRFDEFEYEVLKADTSTLRMYREVDGDVYWLFVAYFSSQKYGSQIHSPKHCLPGGGYRIVSIEPYDLKLNDSRTMTVNRMMIADRRRMELMMYWYETRSGVITDEFGLKIDLMKNAVMLLPTDAAICRLTMPLPLDTDLDEATEIALKFLRDFYPHIQTSLPFAQ